MHNNVLPYDIWLHISRFIPAIQLGELYSVNSALFNIAMDQRYRQISFAYESPKMVRILARLRDPAVAARVRIVYIHPHFLSTVKEQPPQSTYTRRLTELAHLITGTFSSAKQRHRSLSFKSPEHLVSAMSCLLSSLPNITEYHIAWSGLDSIRDLPVPILTAPFGKPQLGKLFLDISLERLHSLLSSDSFRGFGSLQELDLFIRVEPPSSPSTTTTSISYEEVLTLLSISLPESLTSLSIRLWQPIDLTPFFNTLFLPSLTTLKLDIPISAPHMGPAKSIGRWISTHSGSLTTLTLRASQLNGPGYTPLDSSLSSYFDEMIPEIQLGPSLDTLDISLSLIPFSSARSLLHHLSTISLIKSLSITGTHISHTQLLTLFPPQLNSLTNLRLGTISLSPEVFDAFASKLPSLESLTVFIRDILPTGDDIPLFFFYSSSSSSSHAVAAEQEESQIEAFLDRLSSRWYCQWGIERIKILRGLHAGHPTLFDERFEKVLREVFPRLGSVQVGV